MKKWLAIIMVVTVAICGALALTACGDKNKIPEEHAHVADSYEIIKEATCTLDGERSGICTVCGETFTEKIAATGHDWHLQSAEAATCTEAGSETYACANCFEIEVHTVAALGHDNNVVIAAVPVGCETVGWTEGSSCSRCGEIIVAPKAIPAVGHVFYYEKRSNDTHAIYCENCNYSGIADCESDEIEIAPTCTEAGKLIHTCRVCGNHDEHETYAALGHLLTEQKTFYKTVDGVYKHRQTCYRCEYYEEEVCGASVEKTVLPTCETIGYTVYTCEGCGNTYNSDFKDALGHDWIDYQLDDDTSDPYAHTHRRNCQRVDCNAEESGVPVGTVGTVISVRTDETCESDASTRYTCSLNSCNYDHTLTYTNTKLGHSWGDWVYSGDNDDIHNHTHYCLRTSCSASETEDCHMTTSSQAATCTKPEVDVSVCGDCFHVDIDEYPALGHQWSAWISIGTGSSPMHTHVCTVCNLREYGSHSLETTTTQADCEHNEATVNKCSVCGYTTRTERSGTALGHEWVRESSDANMHTLTCSRNPEHTLTEAHDYNTTNVCPYDNEDGLTYGLSVTGDYYIVKNDNGLGKATEIIVPSFHSAYGSSTSLPVRAIDKSAFSANNSIIKVSLPATITAIEEYAFSNCSSLTTILFYGGDSQLTRIEQRAFINCSKLTNITLYGNLTYIGTLAFSGCVSLNNINIPNSVNEVGLSAFSNSGFYNNSANWLNGALYAGLHLIKVNNAYFTDTVTDFTVKSGTISISEYAFESCTGLKKVSIPVSVRTVGTDAFKSCTNLREVEYEGSVSDWFAITFVSTLSSPMYYASHMSILGEDSSELTLPDNITSIPAGTFKGNATITKVTIPATVTSIGDEAFMDCINLKDIVFEGNNISNMGKNAFYNTYFYNTNENWKEGVLILDNHILATNGDFHDTDYVIAENIRTISSGAFAEHDIENLTVGSGVVWFGVGAFKTSALQSVTFKNTSDKWFAKNLVGALRLVSVTDDAVANATLLKNYQGEWRKA